MLIGVIKYEGERNVVRNVAREGEKGGTCEHHRRRREREGRGEEDVDARGRGEEEGTV